LLRGTLAELVAHLRAALPNEGCGLLAAVDEGRVRRVTGWYPGNNIDHSPTHFTMDPVQVVAAMLDYERRGHRLGAIVHSHPRTAPRPSVTDLREAHYQDALLAIVSFAGAEPVLRIWEVRGATRPDDAREVPVCTLPD
jgi:proteasome lid subunit RPN8/RPN11